MTAADPNNALLLCPVTFSATSYVLRVSDGSTSENLPFPATGSLTVGRYYWCSGDGQADSDGGVGGVGDLLTMLKATIEAHTGISSGHITIDLAGALGFGRVNVRRSLSNFVQLLWTNVNTTLSGAPFGFSADTALSSSVTAETQPQWLWRPQRPLARDTRARQPVAAAVTESAYGAVRVARWGLPKKARDIGFVFLPKERILDEYVASTEKSFEAFWTNAASVGLPIRVYSDESQVSSSSGYQLIRARDTNPETVYFRSQGYEVFYDTSIRGRAL